MKSTKLGGAFLDEKCARLPEKELYNMNKTKETPQKGGYGIGLQVNVVIFLGVTLMIAILMSFIGYRSYNTMIEDGIREKYNEVGMKTAAIETRYTAVYQSGQDLRSRVQQILSLPPEQRNRDDLITALRSTVASNDDIVGSGICFEPNAFDGKDAAFVNSPASDATGRAIPYAGKEGSDIVITPLAGYETDEWYQSPRKTQKITLTDPYWYDVTPTQRTYMLTIAFPLIEDGRFVGAVTVDFDAAPFQSDMAAISTPNNFFAVFTPQGTLLAHGLKDDAVSKNVYEMLGVSESEGQKFFGQELFSMERTSESTGLPTTYIFNPIKLKGIEQPWGALVAVSNEMFTHEAKALVLISLLIAVACGAGLIALMSFLIHKRVSAPLKDMAGMIERFAGLDLQKEKNMHLAKYLERGDEIGIITRACGKMASSLRDIVGKINGNSQSVAATSEELTATTQSTANSARNVTTAIHNIADGASKQAQDTQEASDHLDEIQTLLDGNQEILEKINEGTAAVRQRKDEGIGRNLPSDRRSGSRRHRDEQERGKDRSSQPDDPVDFRADEPSRPECRHRSSTGRRGRTRLHRRRGRDPQARGAEPQLHRRNQRHHRRTQREISRGGRHDGSVPASRRRNAHEPRRNAGKIPPHRRSRRRDGASRQEDERLDAEYRGQKPLRFPSDREPFGARTGKCRDERGGQQRRGDADAVPAEYRRCKRRARRNRHQSARRSRQDPSVGRILDCIEESPEKISRGILHAAVLCRASHIVR